jgi:hypothetical protein
MNVLIAFMTLLLDAKCCGAGFENRTIDIPLGKRDIEEANVFSIGVSRLPLLLDEELVLLFGGIASSFFIARSVGLLISSAAPCLERLAEECAGSGTRGCEQGIAFPKSVPEKSAARGAKAISHNARGTHPGASGKRSRGQGSGEEQWNFHERGSTRFSTAPCSGSGAI